MKNWLWLRPCCKLMCNDKTVCVCVPLQGPQGPTGPPGESGEAGAPVSIKDIKSTHLISVGFIVARLILVVFFSLGPHGSTWTSWSSWKERRRCELTTSEHGSVFSRKVQVLASNRQFLFTSLTLSGWGWKTWSCWWAWTSRTTGGFTDIFILRKQKLEENFSKQDFSKFDFPQGARGFPGTPGLPGIKGHRVSPVSFSTAPSE